MSIKILDHEKSKRLKVIKIEYYGRFWTRKNKYGI